MSEKDLEQYKKIHKKILSLIAINAFEYTINNKYELDGNAQQILNAIKYVISNMQVFTIKREKKLYRARTINIISDVDKIHGFSIEESGKITGFNEKNSGKPPKVLAKTGRVNHKWEPILYLASDKYTALSETRSGLREGISVATYNVLSDLRILNFSLENCQFQEAFKENNPEINCYDPQEIYLLIQKILTLPREDEKTYYLSNMIADIAKELDIHGIAYASFYGTGYNVALWKYEESELNYVEPSEVYLHYTSNNAFVSLNDEAYIDCENKYRLLLEKRSNAVDEMKKICEFKMRK